MNYLDKKKILIFIITILIIVISIYPTKLSFSSNDVDIIENNEIIKIENEYMKEYLKKKLKKRFYENVIYKSELETIKEINLEPIIYEIEGKDITSLKYCKNLEKLSLINLGLTDENIRDLEIHNMSKLEEIEISKNQIEEISFIEYLDNLRILKAENNHIKRLELESDSKIEKLYLKNNYLQILDLKGEHLNYVDLSDNRIKNIVFYRENNLKEIDLNNNYIKEIHSSISFLSNLEKLSINNNYIKDPSSIKKLDKLKEIDIRNNYIGNISFIKSLISLEMIDLRYNNIENIEPFEEEISSGLKIDY